MGLFSVHICVKLVGVRKKETAHTQRFADMCSSIVGSLLSRKIDRPDLADDSYLYLSRVGHLILDFL